MFRHERLAPARYQFPTRTQSQSQSQSRSRSRFPGPAFNVLALCNPCSTGNCRRCSCSFFFVFPLRFVLFCIPLLLCSLLRICCTVVSCHEDDGGGGVVRFQFGAAGRSKQRIVNFAFVWSLPNALCLPLLPRLPAALQVKCTRNGRWEEGGVRSDRVGSRKGLEYLCNCDCNT